VGYVIVTGDSQRIQSRLGGVDKRNTIVVNETIKDGKTVWKRS